MSVHKHRKKRNSGITNQKRSLEIQKKPPSGRKGHRALEILSVITFSIFITTILYFRFTVPPFQAIPSQSMKPTFNVGDLIIVKSVSPYEVKKGDIIVVQLPKDIQKSYNYPASVAHLVIQVNHTGGALTFRTKGDNNSGQDHIRLNLIKFAAL